MKFTNDEIRKGMLLYAVTDRIWLKEGQWSNLPSDSGKRLGCSILSGGSRTAEGPVQPP